MGYLRKNSFLIYTDPNAPDKDPQLDPAEVARIEAAHEEGKKGRVEALVMDKLGLTFPPARTAQQQLDAVAAAVFGEMKAPMVRGTKLRAELAELDLKIRETRDEKEYMRLRGLKTEKEAQVELPWDQDPWVRSWLAGPDGETTLSSVTAALVLHYQGGGPAAALIRQQRAAEGRNVPAEQKVEETAAAARAKAFIDPVVADYPLRTPEEAAKLREAVLARVYGEEGAKWMDIVQKTQDASTLGEEAFNEYLKTDPVISAYATYKEFHFAVAVHKVVTSKPDTSLPGYRPYRDSSRTVRFKLGDPSRLAVDVALSGTRWDNEKNQTVATGETTATLWVKVSAGAWAKDGNWGGSLQITCATQKGKWIDSSDGWLTPTAAKGDPVTFYDMGPYYEIWQGTRENGRPLTIQGNVLRFNTGAVPGRFQVQDSTWD